MNKLLPITIVIASLILGGAYYATQKNKQASIERQAQSKLEFQERQAQSKLEFQEWSEEIKIEQAKNDYIRKRKNDCYKIFEKESGKWNNVANYGYVEIYHGELGYAYDDTCEIIYKNVKTGTYFRKYFE